MARAKPARKAAKLLQFEQSTSDQHRTKKTWSIHDLKRISPLTETQQEMFEEFANGQHVFAVGSAGVGKTYLACYLALQALLSPNNNKYDKIIIIRAAVASRDIGFMPGTLEEKTMFYETPYEDIFRNLLGYSKAYSNMKEAGKVQFMTTSFVRGLTFDNALIIVDECQSATFHELYSVLTRIGEDSRVIVCGDGKQDDLHSQRGSNRSGIADLTKVLTNIEEFSTISFTESDIVRSGFVKQFIINCQHQLG